MDDFPIRILKETDQSDAGSPTWDVELQALCLLYVSSRSSRAPNGYKPYANCMEVLHGCLGQGAPELHRRDFLIRIGKDTDQSGPGSSRAPFPRVTKSMFQPGGSYKPYANCMYRDGVLTNPMLILE